MQTKDKNKLLFYFLIILSIFILLFFTKNLYISVLKNMDLVESKEIEATSQFGVLSKLEEVKKNMGKNVKLNKYVQDVKEDELIDYFYSFVSNNRSGSGYIVIDSINFNKGTKNEYGFNEGKINLMITVSDEEKMNDILDFIVSKESKYAFFIDNFSFPNDIDTKGGFQISIPIRMFYK